MKAELTRGLLIDPFNREIQAVELVNCDEDLLRKLLRCEAIERYTIFEGDGLQWELCCDRDSSAKLATHPQCFNAAMRSARTARWPVVRFGSTDPWILFFDRSVNGRPSNAK